MMAKFSGVLSAPRLSAPSQRCSYLEESGDRRRPFLARGFSLIEVLTVVLVLALLAAFLMPAISTLKARSNALRCVSNLRGIGSLATLWSSDNDGTVLPLYVNNDANTLWVRRLLPYIANNLTYEKVAEEPVKPSIFVCPAASSRLGYGHNYANLGWGVSPETNFTVKYAQVAKPSRTVFMVDVANMAKNPPIWSSDVRDPWGVAQGLKDHMVDFRHPGSTANVLWLDGHVSAEKEHPLMDYPPVPPAEYLWDIN